jgi:hypothetical protein
MSRIDGITIASRNARLRRALEAVEALEREMDRTLTCDADQPPAEARSLILLTILIVAVVVLSGLLA